MEELREEIWSDFSIVEDSVGEDTSGEKRLRVTGVLQEADVVNQNKRVYPRDVLDEAVNALSPRIKQKRVFGELDHPELRGSLKNTSHLVTDLRWDDRNPNILVGEMLVLNTPSGLVLKEIIRAGGKPGFSSRGKGKTVSMNRRGIGKVEQIEPGYRFDSFDFVIDPSVKKAQISKIMEGLHLTDSDSKGEDDTMELTLKQLKEEHPELVDALLAEEREKEQADLSDAEVEHAEKEADEALDEIEARINDLETELEEKDNEMEKLLTTIASIVEILRYAEFIEDGSAKARLADSKNEHVAEAAYESKLEEAAEVIDDLTSQLEEAKKTLLTLDEAKRQEEVKAYIAEKVATKQFKTVIAEELAACKTKEEVDARLSRVESLIESVASGETPRGKGRGHIEKESDAEGETNELRESIKARAGISSLKEKK